MNADADKGGVNKNKFYDNVMTWEVQKEEMKLDCILNSMQKIDRIQGIILSSLLELHKLKNWWL